MKVNFHRQPDWRINMDMLSSPLLAKVIILVAAAIVTVTLGNRYGRNFRSPCYFWLVLLRLMVLCALACAIFAYVDEFNRFFPTTPTPIACLAAYVPFFILGYFLRPVFKRQ
jgi:hypothetical protein